MNGPTRGLLHRKTVCATRGGNERYGGSERGGAGNIPACSNLDDTLRYCVRADILTVACGTRWRGGTQRHSLPPLVLNSGAARMQEGKRRRRGNVGAQLD